MFKSIDFPAAVESLVEFVEETEPERITEATVTKC